MAEEKPAEKVEGGNGKQRAKPQQKNQWPSNFKKKFKSEITKLENSTFDCGTANDTALFEESLEYVADYIEMEFKYGGDIGQTLCDLELKMLSKPDIPELRWRTEEPWLYNEWSMKQKKYLNRKEKLEDNVMKAFGIIYGSQCSPALKTRLQGSTGWKEIEQTRDVVLLLTTIRGICCKVNDAAQAMYSLVQIKKRLYYFIQKWDQLNDQYLKEFKALANAVVTFGGSFGMEPLMLKMIMTEQGISEEDQERESTEQKDAALEASKQRYLALLFLSNADGYRYKKLCDNLANQYLMGSDNYPKTLEQAVKLLNNYRSGIPKYRPKGGRSDENVAFVQGGEEKKKKDKSHIECYNCHEKGHYASECPSKGTEDGVANLNINDEDDEFRVRFLQMGSHDYTFHQSGESGLNKNHVYLDTCSTFHQIVNADLVKSIKETKNSLTGRCNAGTTHTNKKGKFGSLEVWVNEQGIANILSFDKLEEHFEISYHTKETNKTFIVHTNKGDLHFKRNAIVLPYIDATKSSQAA